MFDLAVIGLGPAGLEAINIALENNLKVIAFEKEEIGGTCLNKGCVPTKSILHSSEIYSKVTKSSSLGINFFSEPSFDWSTILSKKAQIVSTFNRTLKNTLSKNITLINSEAELFLNDNEAEIYADDNIYLAKNVIIATGSKPAVVKGLEPDNVFVLTSDDMFDLPMLPKSIVIVGSGAIGLEWAKILSDLRVQVHLIELAPVLSPNSDIEIQKRIERILKQNKVQIHKNTTIVDYCNGKVELSDASIIKADCILSAVGRVPVMPSVKVNGINEQFKLSVNDDYTTDFDGLFVVGDATNGILLAHNAQYQARCVMNKILFNKEVKNKQVPSVIYLTPEIASIGLREQDIEDLDNYKIVKMPLASIAKSWCDNQNDGLIKLIIKDRKIKGAHIVSNEASSLISLIGVFIEKEISIDEIKDMIFPHPSYPELIQEVLRGV